MYFKKEIELRDSKASTECNFEVGESQYGVCKTGDGQTSVTYEQNPIMVMSATHT